MADSLLFNVAPPIQAGSDNRSTQIGLFHAPVIGIILIRIEITSGTISGLAVQGRIDDT
jgi:hypothetical protein